MLNLLPRISCLLQRPSTYLPPHRNADTHVRIARPTASKGDRLWDNLEPAQRPGALEEDPIDVTPSQPRIDSSAGWTDYSFSQDDYNLSPGQSSTFNTAPPLVSPSATPQQSSARRMVQPAVPGSTADASRVQQPSQSWQPPQQSPSDWGDEQPAGDWGESWGPSRPGSWAGAGTGAGSSGRDPPRPTASTSYSESGLNTPTAESGGYSESNSWSAGRRTAAGGPGSVGGTGREAPGRSWQDDASTWRPEAGAAGQGRRDEAPSAGTWRPQPPLDSGFGPGPATARQGWRPERAQEPDAYASAAAGEGATGFQASDITLLSPRQAVSCWLDASCTRLMTIRLLQPWP